VLTTTFNSYGDSQISPPPHKINTPEPIDKKIARIDYICEGTSYTEFGRNPFFWGILSKWVKYNKNYFYLFICLFIPFFLISLQVRPVDGFLRALAQKT